MSVEGLSSDKDSGSDSQNELCKIPALPAPADFLSSAGASAAAAATVMPKLMTPDAFMTPSASVSDPSHLITWSNATFHYLWYNMRWGFAVSNWQLL